MESKYIHIKGARVHNLKNIEVKIPRYSLTVMTGLSGSGKSSLAFDTIYAEGHRRFVQSLSSYARQFLGQMDKPEVDFIEGLSPTIAIDQKTTSKNPRSTVGTVTEIYDYMRLLFARAGVPHCPICHKEIKSMPTDVIIDSVLSLPIGTKFMIIAPIAKGKKGTFDKTIQDLMKQGFTRGKIDGEIVDLADITELDKNKKHDIEVIVDRLILKEDIRSRLSGSIETALKLGNKTIAIYDMTNEKEYSYSQNYMCEEHDFSIPELEPRMFSFNSPFGACPHCLGIGSIQTLSRDRVIPDTSLSLRDGAVNVNGFRKITEDSWSGALLKVVGEEYGFTLDTKICDYTETQLSVLFDGTGKKSYHCVRYWEGIEHNSMVKWHGLITTIKQRKDANWSEAYDELYTDIPCPECAGKRLKPEILNVTFCSKNIDEICSMCVSDIMDFFNNIVLNEYEKTISNEILKEIKARLKFLCDVGLGYLTLSRNAGSLSGGESQRIRLATQIGSHLSGVIYILDEPSIGLHQRDNSKLITTLKELRDSGNTVIVVEHDEETMLSSDYIIDIGPGAGVHGGNIVFAGTPKEILKSKDSLTGKYLSKRLSIPTPNKIREGNGNYLIVKGAQEHNLKNIDVKIPLGKFVCVSGVSGSGKSSLVNNIILLSLQNKLNHSLTYPGKCSSIEGYESLDKVIAIDQSPIGRTPRSNPATYTGLFSDIRELFSKTPEAQAKGFLPGRFSFNIQGGRCEACQGDGVKCIEMNFLPDVYVVCDVCKGKRYNQDTLSCKYKGKNISDVLNMTVEEGLEFFNNLPKLKRKLQTLYDVGLGYIQIGQSSTTLSGGEAQRVKLATELSKVSTGNTMYILDEPTTGLHNDDVYKLLTILNRLVDNGNSIIVIEHNLDVLKNADYIIDLGPEGGNNGGNLIACGTPKEITKNENSFTGQYLRQYFE